MADKNGRERLSMYFNTKNEKEMELWDYIKDKYSKSAFVKEAIEEKMLRELNGVITPPITLKEDLEVVEQTKKLKLNSKDKKNVNQFGGGF